MTVASKRDVTELQIYLQDILKNEGRHLFKKKTYLMHYTSLNSVFHVKKKIMRSFPCVGGDVGVEGPSHG